MKEDINDVIQEENDDKVNVADDDEIKHEASLTYWESTCSECQEQSGRGPKPWFTATISYSGTPFDFL